MSAQQQQLQWSGPYWDPAAAQTPPEQQHQGANHGYQAGGNTIGNLPPGAGPFVGPPPIGEGDLYGVYNPFVASGFPGLNGPYGVHGPYSPYGANGVNGGYRSRGFNVPYGAVDPYGAMALYGGISPYAGGAPHGGSAAAMAGPPNNSGGFQGLRATANPQPSAHGDPYSNIGSSRRNATGAGTPSTDTKQPAGAEATDNPANSDLEKEACLSAHNDARGGKGLQPLQWSDELAQHAARWAQQCASNDKMEHEQQQNQGENLSWYSGMSPSWAEAVEDWLDEEADYDGGPVRPGGPMVKHYTQCLWSGTTHVGMASARSKSGTVYVCARYWPRGNHYGQKPY